MKLVDTFEYHRSRPEESLEDYYRQKRIELSASLENKLVIYLDTKFWVLMRNGLSSPETYYQEYKLLNLARELVISGRCVFPISEDVYLEVIRQTDPQTLLNTVKLIDELSLGISTISYEERTKLELLHFWYSHTGKNIHDLSDLVWTKLAYNMGYTSFDASFLSSAENLVAQKAFTDQMWEYSLEDQIEQLLSQGALDNLPEQPNANKINEGQFQYQHEASSFKQMFLNEVGGWVESYHETLSDMMKYMYKLETGNQKITLKETAETQRLLGNCIYNTFKYDKVGLHLPSVRIISGLYATVRWDKLQKFQDHDFHDFRHATTALPYCDYFFTEKRLTHLVSQKLLAFDKLFNCKVYAKVNDAIKCLESL